MERSREYLRVEFNATAIRKIVEAFKDIVDNPAKTSFGRLAIKKKSQDSWRYDTFEEFLSELDKDRFHASIEVRHSDLSLSITIWPAGFSATQVSISSMNRDHILRLGNVIDGCAEDCYIPAPAEPKQEAPKPRIFIGHGGSPQWRDLKDHLHEHHDYDVVSYETGSRAGHTIRDVIAEMLDSSAFAILVMTAEDRMDDGTLRARQNVIHEIGLFQGRLGFSKAIVLKEEGTEEFSNINGVNQIRYDSGRIKETFGAVLAVLKREFGEDR